MFRSGRWPRTLFPMQPDAQPPFHSEPFGQNPRNRKVDSRGSGGDRALRIAIQVHRWLLTAADEVLTSEQRRSRAYLQADLALLAGTTPTGRAGVWMAHLQFLDTGTRQLPQQNSRRPESKSVQERFYAEWLRRQRRAAREGRLCSYQLDRLKGLYFHFCATPADYDWDNKYRFYGRFLAVKRRPPRSTVIWNAEGGLGRWAARQRYLKRRGKLSAQRVASLESLRIWTWGHGWAPDSARRPTRTPNTSVAFPLHPRSCTEIHWPPSERALCVAANVARRSRQDPYGLPGPPGARPG